MGVELARVRMESTLGEGTLGHTHSVRLEDGSVVAAKHLKRGAVLPPLQELGRLGPSGARALVPIHSVVSEAGEKWVLGELASGVSLQSVLERGRLAPMCAVAVAMGVLDAVAALHQVGLWHGAIHAGNVHLGPDGSVRLGDYCLTSSAGQTQAKLRAADSQAVGVLLCAMLRLPVDADGGRERQRSSKLAQSPLGQLARRLARGPRGKRVTASAAIDARLALWEAAGRLATRRMQAAAKERLAEIVAGPPTPTPPPAAPAVTVVASERPHDFRRLVAFVAAAVVVASVMAVSPQALLRPASGSRSPEGAASSAFAVRAAPEEAAPAAVQSPPTEPRRALPILGPAAAGQVSGVSARLVDPACSVGTSCLVHVEVWLRPSTQPRLVAWTVKSIAPCGGPIVDLGRGAFTARPGWTHVASENAFALPKLRLQALVVVSTAPDVAASEPLLMGDAAAC